VKKKAKQYSRDFVTRSVDLTFQSDRPIADVARDLGVEYATLYGWMKKAGKTKVRLDAAATTPLPTPSPPKEAAMQAEVERLRRELEEVKKERDFLKKRRRSSRSKASEVRLHWALARSSAGAWARRWKTSS
jgi:transposase